MKAIRRIVVLLLLFLCLSGCGGDDASGVEVPASSAPTALVKDSEMQTSLASMTIDPNSVSETLPGKRYQAPEISPTVFHGDAAEGTDGVWIDTSAVCDGYVAVSAENSARLKFQVIMNETTYTYDLPNDGTETIYGLQSGDGHYLFRIMKNTTGSKYTKLFSTETDVTLKDEFQPFLRTNQYAQYDSSSDCVKQAAEIAAASETALDVVSGVFRYICDGVEYDKEKAETVEPGYIPDPDETIQTGKGICFDYAALAAAMLRSQGIPTKIIFGYVSPGDLYHAWNMFYTDETGWITVDYQVNKDNWTRLDLTFSANGGDVSSIGDGGSYSDLYVY